MSGAAQIEPAGRWGAPAPAQLETTGIVLVVDEQARIVHVSETCDALLGAPATEVVGTTLQATLGSTAANALAIFRKDGLDRAGTWQPARLPDGTAARLRAFTAAPGLAGLDVLPAGTDDGAADPAAIERIAGWNDWLASCTSSVELLGVVASVTRERLGFDGVRVQRIEPEGQGTVLACAGDAELGAPAGEPGDLPPAQPRVRGRALPFFVADLERPGTQLVPGSEHVDLDGSWLLRPYPAFLARLAGAQVRAVASLPLLVGGRLWGHAIAHHRQARSVGAATQAELRLLAAAASVRLAELIDQEDAREQVELARYSLRLIGGLGAAPDLIDGLVRSEADLLGVAGADGAVVTIDDAVASVGSARACSPEQQAALLTAARAALEGLGGSVTASTVRVDPAAGVDPDLAAGLLALRLSSSTQDLVVWLRGEDAGTAGRVAHQLDGDALAGELFAGATAHGGRSVGTCAPWTSAQLAQAAALREAIDQLQAARYAEARTLNVELMRANEEYDAFAHAAAHDLKAPLRGISQNAEFLLEDLEGRMSEEEAEQLRTITRLTRRMHDLLEDLMTYAQVGKVALAPEPVALTTAADEALELLGLQVPGEATVTVAPATFHADPAALRHILLNLIGNAVKYSEGPAAISVDVVTLGEVREAAPPPGAVADAPDGTAVLRVADQGMGIDPAHHEHVFTLFRQLDPRAAGSGTGLAICRLISRRHGGEIWLSSAVGQGTTCYVMSAVDPAP